MISYLEAQNVMKIELKDNNDDSARPQIINKKPEPKKKKGAFGCGSSQSKEKKNKCQIF